MNHYQWDHNKTRLNLLSTTHPGKYNWFFIPGGAGMDSRYLHELAQACEFPGTCWAVDFPGNGDNFVEDESAYLNWGKCLVDLISAHENPIIVGHSFGAMITLTQPELEQILKGFIILNSSPTNWVPARLEELSKRNLSLLTPEYQKYKSNPTTEAYDTFIKLCLPHLFTKPYLEKGFDLYKTVPYNFKAYEWWSQVGPETYNAKWAPSCIPALIFCGGDDCVTPPRLFTEDKRFHRENIQLIELPRASHFAWFESMADIQHHIHKFIERLN